MRIASITVYGADLPIEHGPYLLSGGRELHSLESTIVAVETDCGLVGWGESCPFGPAYIAAHARGVRAGIDELAPHVLGRDPRRVERLNDVMDAALPGHAHAKAAIDIACWDILGKATGLPVCELLGGRTTEPLRLVSSISSGTPEAMAARVERLRAKGYRAHSIKVGGCRAADDVARVGHVLDARQPDEAFLIDVNRGWTLDTALVVARALDGRDVVVEQPCATYRECRAFRRRTGLPVMLDELIDSEAALLEMIADDAADALNLKVCRAGGLTKARRQRDICAVAGIALTIQDTGGSDIAFAAITQLAQSTPARVLRSIWDCRELGAFTTADGAPVVEQGFVQATERPGLGVTPRVEVLGTPLAAYGTGARRVA